MLNLKLTVFVFELFEGSSTDGLFCISWDIAKGYFLVDSEVAFLAAVITLILFPIF